MGATGLRCGQSWTEAPHRQRGFREPLLGSKLRYPNRINQLLEGRWAVAVAQSVVQDSGNALLPAPDLLRTAPGLLVISGGKSVQFDYFLHDHAPHVILYATFGIDDLRKLNAPDLRP